MMHFFKAIQIMGVAAAWLARAGADGRITVAEVAELGTQIAAALGLSVVAEVPAAKPFNPPQL